MSFPLCVLYAVLSLVGFLMASLGCFPQGNAAVVELYYSADCLILIQLLQAQKRTTKCHMCTVLPRFRVRLLFFFVWAVSVSNVADLLVPFFFLFF